MVVVITIDRDSTQLNVTELDPKMWHKMRTLMGWIKENPKCWEVIKNFVYRNKLNKSSTFSKFKRLMTE